MVVSLSGELLEHIRTDVDAWLLVNVIGEYIGPDGEPITVEPVPVQPLMPPPSAQGAASDGREETRRPSCPH